MTKPAMPPPMPPIEPTYKTCNHILHLILSVVTMGIWSFVWLAMAIIIMVDNKNSRQTYEQNLKAYNFAYWQWQQANN